jgi:3',5'-cyclic AMP phosphodiesterase CpdA
MHATRTLAHLSDLHIGRTDDTSAAAEQLCAAVLASDVDEVLVTGDVTHRGRWSELAEFERIFAPLAGRLVVVPGNHDRLGEDAGRGLMKGGRVAVESRPGAHIVRFDSTAEHNRHLARPHGELTCEDVSAIDEAIAAAPPGALSVLMLHHHLLPLPADDVGERIATWLGWSMAMELELGHELVECLRGRCDVVLHGHRHAAGELVLLPRRGRALHVLNAGCSPELGAFRVLRHADGRLLSDEWLRVRETIPVAVSGFTQRPVAA